MPDETVLQGKGLILVRTLRYPAYHYGDRLETPPVFETFSYKNYPS